MKCPHQLAIMHVPRAHVASGPERGRFLRPAANDDQVLVHDRRRAQPIIPRKALQDLWRVEIDDALLPERVTGRPRLCVERIEFPVRRTEHDLWRRHRIPGEVLDTTNGWTPRGQLERPNLRPFGRVERDDAAVWRGYVHDAVDHKGRRLAGRETAGGATEQAAALRRGCT